MSRAHALLSASSAARWIRCTAAPHMEEKFPDTTSTYAKEGTLAHAICELKLRKYAIEPMSQRTYSRRFNVLKKDELYQAEMDGFTDEYLEVIKRIMLQYPSTPFVTAEKRVDFSQYVPEGFGTADCIILHGGDLHVCDFKYGKGVAVSAEGNPQMRLYALGALKAYQMMYAPKKVFMHIIQPRISNFSDDEMMVEELVAWGEKIAVKAKEAYEGPGTFAPSESACRFCRARQQCKARSEFYAAMEGTAKEKPDPHLITPEELGTYLTKAKALEAWAKDLQEYALTCCLAGKTVPGWKAVEGRGSRSFDDQEAAFKVLMDHGIAEAVLYERVPLTLAKAEKIVGKKEFEVLLGAHIVKSPGKPTLAPETDKRAAISLEPKVADLFEDLTSKGE